MSSPAAGGAINLRRGDVSGTFSPELAPFGEDLLSNIDSIMDRGEFLKVDKTCTVAAVKIGDIRTIIKRYNYKGILHASKQVVKQSRAKRCWRWGRELRRLGVSTPRPLGYLEIRKFGFKVQAYLITEYIDGELLSELLAVSTGKSLEKLKHKADMLLKQLESHKLLHRDLQARNVMVAGEQLFLIDLDSMRRTVFITKPYDKGKDRRHFVRKLKRDGLDSNGI